MTITPAHSFIDFELAQKYGFDVVQIINEKGELTEAAGPEWKGMNVKEASEKLIETLEKKGLVERIDGHTLPVPRGDRSGAVLEPWLTDQWYVKIAPLAEPRARCRFAVGAAAHL